MCLGSDPSLFDLATLCEHALSLSLSTIDEDGSLVAVFGGFVNRSSTSDHSVYFLDTKTWIWTVSTSNSVRGRSYSACAFSGNQLIVWGGKHVPFFYLQIHEHLQLFHHSSLKSSCSFRPLTYTRSTKHSSTST
jgi:hypothetical protein